MEKSTNRKLNELLVNLFHNVMDIEAEAVITEEFKDITNNDMHIIEAIGNDEPRSMSMIAKSLNITVGTLTTNMNSLEEKKYILIDLQPVWQEQKNDLPEFHEGLESLRQSLKKEKHSMLFCLL